VVQITLRLAAVGVPYSVKATPNADRALRMSPA
jgi:hypothetical protein